MPDVPVVVLGAGGVGKSCLTIQYVQGHFVDKYDATIEDVYRKPVDIDGIPAVLTVVDTAGQDTFGAMRDQYMRKGQGFVLVYSITDTESFVQVQRIYNQLRQIRGASKSSPCVLVANKVDQDTYRAVDKDRGRQLASEVMRCPFLEVTAKDHKMAEEVFEVLVRTIRSGGMFPTAVGSLSPAHAPSATGGASSPAGADTQSRGGAAKGDPSLTDPSSTAASPDASSRKKKKKRCTLL